jgi:UDP-GlcNAc:undecaprenyl-phosphate/decaprenyl-phosphate GlcNAc-1-phosphate transferase
MSNYILIIFFLIFNLGLFFIFDKYYSYIQVYDKPDLKIKKHKKKIPVYGGMIFFINFFLFFFIDILFLKNFFIQFNYHSIFFMSAVVFIIGVIDDLKNLNPFIKTVLIILASFVVLFFNDNLILTSLKLDSFNEINLNHFSFIFTILCIFLFINAYNMHDGVNLNIGFYNLFLLFFLFYKSNYELIFMIFLICNFFFLIYNYKNLTFFGNNGSYFFSFFLSILLIFSFKKYASINEEDIILVLIFPIFEVLRLFVLRILKNKSPFIGDLNHFHHIIINRFGFRVGIIFCQVIIIFPYLTNFLFDLNLWLIILIFSIVYFSIFILIKSFKKIKF